MSLRSPSAAVLRTAVAALAVLTLLPAAGDAQSLGDRLKKRAKEAAERTVERRVDKTSTEATDAALDKAETTVKCAATDRKCIDTAKREGKKVVTVDESESGANAPATTSAAPAKRGSGAANVGRDFTPGTRVLYATDFKRDELGDFPRAFELKGGNFEVAEIDGVRYLRGTSYGEFEIPLKESLPEMFTMEFEMQGVSGWEQNIYFVSDKDDTDAHYLSFNVDQAGIEGPGQYRVMSSFKARGDEIQPVQIMADGRYVKVYVNGVRVANAPNAKLGRSSAIRFIVKAKDDHPFLLGPIRIAAGGKDLYKALDESGRVTAEGIFFDTSSDRLRPESEAALKEIGDMMTKHADLRLLIEGHTDNVGGTAKNQTLSDRRAAAVRQYLLSNHGIAADRLESKGFGASKPAGDNATEDGRQRNRRVELVKL
jgi:OOP family OmpA-OmpF porin